MREVQWTDEELAELRRLLAREWAVSREEFHHTRNLDYRADVKAHLDQIGAMMRKLETAAPTVPEMPPS